MGTLIYWWWDLMKYEVDFPDANKTNSPSYLESSGTSQDCCQRGAWCSCPQRPQTVHEGPWPPKRWGETSQLNSSWVLQTLKNETLPHETHRSGNRRQQKHSDLIDKTLNKDNKLKCLFLQRNYSMLEWSWISLTGNFLWGITRVSIEQ